MKSIWFWPCGIRYLLHCILMEYYDGCPIVDISLYGWASCRQWWSVCHLLLVWWGCLRKVLSHHLWILHRWIWCYCLWNLYVLRGNFCGTSWWWWKYHPHTSSIVMVGVVMWQGLWFLGLPKRGLPLLGSDWWAHGSAIHLFIELALECEICAVEAKFKQVGDLFGWHWCSQM